MPEIDPRAFDEYEAVGWEAVAVRYEELWSPITRQAIEPLLDAAGVEAGLRVLDIGTGTGDAAASAVARGADATGVDVASAMVEISARRHPEAEFMQGSATELPFTDQSFDAAIGNIVIQHVGEPDRAARELLRVLVPRGRVALSTWDEPEHSPFFESLLGAIADAEVPPPSDVPPGPSFFQFGEDDECFPRFALRGRLRRRRDPRGLARLPRSLGRRADRSPCRGHGANRRVVARGGRLATQPDPREPRGPDRAVAAR